MRFIFFLYRWFHGNVSRADAIILLKASRDEPGTFLVRESESKIGILYCIVYNDNDNRPVLWRHLVHYHSELGAPDYSTDTVSEFHAKALRQL